MKTILELLGASCFLLRALKGVFRGSFGAPGVALNVSNNKATGFTLAKAQPVGRGGKGRRNRKGPVNNQNMAKSKAFWISMMRM